MEFAIECGWVRDESTCMAWLSGLIAHSLATFELPVLHCFMQGWELFFQESSEQNFLALQACSDDYIASRETAELPAETLQMGYSLKQLFQQFDDLPPLFTHAAARFKSPCFPALWAGLSCHWKIPPDQAINGYAFAWLENQTLAAMKTIPLGQAAGQRILYRLSASLPSAVESAMNLPQDQWSSSSMAMALASSWHETQYSRLFRS
jgi:urease accessory protein